MYSFICRFYVDQSQDEIALLSYPSALVSNGQILAHWDITSAEGYAQLACIAPAKDSLDQKYHDSYAADAFKKLLAVSVKEPECVLVGASIGLDPECSCESSSSYVLFTTFMNPEPPVLCGDCGLNVPLYRLPHFGEEEDYGSLLQWQQTYQACDELYMLSGVGERFGRRETCSAKSKLASEGLKICHDLSAKLGTPFYYFLCAQSAACRLCGETWQKDRLIAQKFDLICEKCSLVQLSE